MGFFYSQSAADARASRKTQQREIPIALMKDQGCRACPANEVDTRRETPKMPPAGSDKPLVYVLGQSPTKGEDETGKHFSTEAFDPLRSAIPADIRQRYVRYGHAVRCRALGEKRDPREAMCCSGLLEQDIEDSKPRVVLGLGPMPITWAFGTGKPDFVMRGRLWPIKVRSHVCWYYCVQDPLWLAAMQKERRHDTEFLAMFRRDVSWLFSHVDDLGPPPYVEEGDRTPGEIVLLDGSNEWHYDSLAMFLDEARSAPHVGIDFETTRLRPYSKEALIVTCSISTLKKTVAFAVRHPLGWGGEPTFQAAVERLLLAYLADSNPKVAHNTQFELEWVAAKFDKRLVRMTDWEDSMAAAHTLDERRGALGLGDQTRLRFGFDVKAMSNIDTKRILEYPLLHVLKYNALDSAWCLRLFLDIHPEIPAKLLPEYERKLKVAASFVLMQQVGLTPDLKYAQDMRDVLKSEKERAQRLISKSNEVQKFERELGRSFVLGGDDEVVLLRDIMKREEGVRGSSYSVDEAVLSSIPKTVGIAPSLILDYRAVDKALGTYIDPVLNQDPKAGTVLVHSDGLIHTVYKVMDAETGRGASEDPNVQNYPKRKRKEIRGYVVTPDGRVFVFGAFDYGQLEARVCAMASEDKNLVDALWTDFDIHGHWAERFVVLYPEIKDWIVSEFEVDWDEKGMKTLRQEAKNKWVFPQFFGSSTKSCAMQLNLPEAIAEEAGAEFWDQFRGVKRWQKKVVESYSKKYYVETLTGRRRHGPLSYNQIINTPIQGTGADIVLDAQDRITMRGQLEERWQLVPPLNVHDDLTFALPRATMIQDTEDIAYMMCDCRMPFINVPVLVEVSVSQYRWHELSEIGVYRSDELGIHKR